MFLFGLGAVDSISLPPSCRHQPPPEAPFVSKTFPMHRAEDNNHKRNGRGPRLCQKFESLPRYLAGILKDRKHARPGGAQYVSQSTGANSFSSCHHTGQRRFANHDWSSASTRTEDRVHTLVMATKIFRPVGAVRPATQNLDNHVSLRMVIARTCGTGA